MILFVFVALSTYSIYSTNYLQLVEALPISEIIVSANSNDVAVNENTNFVYVTHYDDDIVSVIDGDAYSVIKVINVGDRPVGIITLNSINKVYVTNWRDDTVSVIDGNTNEVVNTITVGNGPSHFTKNEGDNIVYVTNNLDDTVSVIDGNTNEVVNTITVGDNPFDLILNEDTDKLYVTNRDDDTVSVIDGNTNEVVNTITVGDYPLGISLNEDTDKLYVTNRDDDTVSVIDGNTDEVVNTITVGDYPKNSAVNDQTNRIYITNQRHDTISVIDGNADEVVKIVDVGDAPHDITVNENANKIYVTNYNESIISVIHDQSEQLVVLNVPNNGSTVHNKTINFKWISQDSTIVKYILEISTTATFNNIIFDEEYEFTDITAQLGTDGNYYWRIIAKDNNENTYTSQTFSFSLDISPIPEPPIIEVTKTGPDSAEVAITQEPFNENLPNQFRIKIYDPKTEPNPIIDHQNDVLGYNSKGPITGLGPGKECVYVTASWDPIIYDNTARGWLNSETKCLDFEGADNEPPTLEVPKTIKKFVDQELGGLEVVFKPKVFDNVDSASSLRFTCDPPSGSFFEIGTHQVTCSVTDSAGLTTTDTITVIVEPDPGFIDSDKDGIIDKDDRCPTQPETYNEYLDTDGCPDDNISDKLDKIKGTIEDPEIKNLLNTLEKTNDEQLSLIKQQQQDITNLKETNDEQLSLIKQQQQDITNLKETNDEQLSLIKQQEEEIKHLKETNDAQNEKLTESLTNELEQSEKLQKITEDNAKLREEQTYSTLITIVISIALAAAGIIASIILKLSDNKQLRELKNAYKRKIEDLENQLKRNQSN